MIEDFYFKYIIHRQGLQKIDFLVYVDKKLKLKQNPIVKLNTYEKDKNIVNIYHQDADFDLVFSSIQNKSQLIDWRKQNYANLFKKKKSIKLKIILSLC